MRLKNLNIVPLMLVGATLMVLSGCDKGSGTPSESAIAGVPPVAVDDTANGVSGQPTIVPVVANDTDIENNLDVSSVQIVGTANPGDSLVVSGEGTWSVSDIGSVTFTPEVGFTNDPSIIEYVVSDIGGLVSNTATITIDYPQTAPVAVDDDANGTSGLPVHVNVLANDTDAENDINTSSVHIGGTTNPGDTLEVSGEGNWSVSAMDRVIFTPEAGFTADPTPITYTITDNTGLTSNAATVTVDYPQTEPVAVDDNETNTTLGQAVTLNVVANDTDAENDINPSTVHFVDIDAINTDNDDDNDRLEVEGEGNWTVDEDGNVTFTPEVGFIGSPTAVFYTVTDKTGLESNEANITIVYPSTLASCKAYYESGLSAVDGNYTIDPDGPGGIEPFEVYCDMTSDGGGYSIKTVTLDTELFAPDAEAYCSENYGMQLFVPRTESHLTNAVTKYGAEYFFIMGIYPNYNGARCTYTPFNSDSCMNWSPNDNGIWYVSNRTNIGEPNGDNVMGHSMGYNFTGTSVSHYNDYPTGYSSQYFACSAVDDPLANVSTFSNNTPVILNNPGITTSTINVTGATTSISGMRVGVNISAFIPTTLVISLKSPSGTTIVLNNDPTMPLHTTATFSDDGTLVPEEPLSTLNSEDANGMWTLEIDYEGMPFLVPDTLNSWSITIE